MTDKMISLDISPKDTFGINPGDECTSDTPIHVSSVVFPFPTRTSYAEINDTSEATFHLDVQTDLDSNDKSFLDSRPYGEIQRMTCQMAKSFAKPGSEIYDIGCSTGEMLLQLHQKVGPHIALVGVDHSVAMLKKVQMKLNKARVARRWKLVKADVNHKLPITNASVVTMLSLPTGQPLHSQQIMQQIYQGLNNGGCVIFSENLAQENPRINQIFVGDHYNFRQDGGYSEIELTGTTKREALENALLPRRFEESRKLLKSIGFTAVEEFFRWYNYCGIIAIK